MQSDVLRCFPADQSLAMFNDWFALHSCHHISLAFQETDALPGVPPQVGLQ